jgi:hypothetical protein
MASLSAKRSFQQKIQNQLLVLKMTGTLLVNYRKGKFVASNRRTLAFSVLVCLVSNLQPFLLLCDKILVISRTSATPRDVAIIIGKVFYQMTSVLCIHFIMFRTNQVAQLLNRYQTIFINANVGIKSLKQAEFCFCFSLYLLVYLGNTFFTDFVNKASFSYMISRQVMKMFICSLTFSIFFFKTTLKILFLKVTESILSCKPSLTDRDLLKSRKLVQIIFECCDTIQKIYGPTVLVTITADSFLVLFDVFELVRILSLSDARAQYDLFIYAVFVAVYALNLVLHTHFCDIIIKEVQAN